MLRLTRLAPLTCLLLSFTAACGDDNKSDPPDEMAGAGGDDGGSGGTTAGTGGSKGGKGGMGGKGGAGGKAGSGNEAGMPEGGAPPEGGGPTLGGEAGDGGEPPVDCSKQATAPAEVEILSGFTRSEDFAFDELGNYVGVDDSNNLIRVSKDGKKEVWAPNIGSTAGMAILPDGSAVVCDVGNGAVKRVYPNGASEIVIGGLLYPNGLDVGPDGYIYVAENFGDRVRRVNPENGEFTVVAMGLKGPNGVAFSNDPKILYVGSFEGSGIYKVEIPKPGELGVSTVFARPNGSTLPEPELACPDQEVGKPCVIRTTSTAGTCRQLSNVVDCIPSGPCDDKKDGDECGDGFGLVGTCQSGSCIPKSACEGKEEGDACSDNWGNPGTCQTGQCVPTSCSGKGCCGPVGSAGSASAGSGNVGGSSSSGGSSSIGGDDGNGCCMGPDCGSGGSGNPSSPCDGLSAGDACNDPFNGPGKCYDFGGGFLVCQPPGPCDGLSVGDACTDPFNGPGKCVDSGPGPLYCEPPNPCEGLMVGDACTSPQFGVGVCNQDFGGYLYCDPPNPCEGKPDGEACEYFGSPGTCENEWCYPNPCEGMNPGDTCWSNEGQEGLCVGPEAGPLECLTPCGGKADGDMCTVGALDGQCLDETCTFACTDQTLGQACVLGDKLGYCTNEGAGPVCLQNQGPGPGGIDGLGVDACGFVYAAEYQRGNVWRISPAGEIEKLADLPSGWIPNIKWGRGLGGFDKDVMFVADRDEGRLFGISVGVPGATEYYDIGAKQ
jgi:sugar lactone lactonase YvrE